ncbi:regulator of G protein signaling superfamily [Backusella circina FSU 941]|nr:regulator of G protein signaling superfamily [Backusella circina FSU 941]
MPNSDPSHSTYTSMMRLTKNGRPFTKDLYDMFAAVIMQINLTDHRILFRTYPYTFTTDEATNFKKSFQFIHVDHSTDAEGRQISTRTTTTFSMDYNTAKRLLQYFLDARLIKNIGDPNSDTVRDKGLWRPTPKGKCVLTDFSQETQVKLTQTLLDALTSPIINTATCRFIWLDRLSNDDQIMFCRANMTAAFKAMCESLEPDTLMLDDIGGIEKRHLVQYEHSYVGLHCVDWICDHISVSCREEGEAVAAEFVLCGWLAQVLDKSNKSLNIREKDVSFKTTRNAIYHVTNRGCLVVGWKTTDDSSIEQSGISINSNGSNKKSYTTAPPGDHAKSIPEEDQSDAASTTSSIDMACEDLLVLEQSSSTRPPSMSLTDSSMSRSSTNSTTSPQQQQKRDVSQWARLFHILETPLLRMYFRDFLRASYCVENINFWVDHNHLLKHLRNNTRTQLELLSECYCIYETYIGPKATADVNIDHTLLQDTIHYVNTVFTISNKPPPDLVYFLVPASAGVARSAKPPRQLLLPSQIASKKRIVSLNKDITIEKCLMKLIKMLGRVSEHVCRIMAEDSVPKFAKTEKYKELIQAEEDLEIKRVKDGTVIEEQGHEQL